MVYGGQNPAKNGLTVSADHVFAYGLAAEHTIEDNVVWDGDFGTILFYQAEIMYDALEPTWDHSCLSVGGNATQFKATGLGCYSFFRDANVRAPSSFKLADPTATKANIDKAVSVFLNGVEGSGIDSVIEGDGEKVGNDEHVKYHCV